jgi:hypothetical protein
MQKTLFFLISVLFISCVLSAQSINDFISVNPASQSQQFIIPSTHKFQKIIEVGDFLTSGETMPVKPDFSGYVPISNSNINGYLSINSESSPGGNTVLDIIFNTITGLWETTASQKIDFSPVFGTIRNCSGTVTPWNTIISSEEANIYEDNNLDGYNDNGWNVEINPETKTVISKLWTMGNFAHENVAIHTNERTVYQGADSNPGYLYKFVADTEQNLTSGSLYVFSGDKNGSGNWILLNNTTQEDRNTTLTQSLNVGGTIFNGVEDVEIGLDGMVYFAVKGERRVYRFQDSDPISGTSLTMETYIGAMNYDINHESGSTSVPWGIGNDNLAFDDQGNLWVFQDGDNNYIWVVENGHTQANPKVKIFGISPLGSEPTGITFTPDYKYLFMSIQHPDITNNAMQTDAEGNVISFSKGVTLVIALNEYLGETLSVSESKFSNPLIYPNPARGSNDIIIKYGGIKTIKIYDIIGKLIYSKICNDLNEFKINLKHFDQGVYLLQLNNTISKKIIID